MKTFHDYTEAQQIISEAANYGVKITQNMTFGKLCDKLDEADYQYEYSPYTHDLLSAVATDLNILETFVEIMNGGITPNNIQYINEAIFNLVREIYGDRLVRDMPNN